MKKFAELELIQNLTWKQVIAYSTISLTTLIGATWTIATRAVDSKADYVNMRYGEISVLEAQLKVLQEENLQLKSKLGNSSLSKEDREPSKSKVQETKLYESYIDEASGLIYAANNFYSDSVYLKYSLPNGKNDSAQIYSGSGFTFQSDDKTYQFILISIDRENKKIKALIKEIPNKQQGKK